MIRFEPAPKPDGVAERAEARGQTWLAANSTGRPYDYWSEFKPQLADAFRNLCAYSAMYEPVGTVDHFVSCDEDRTKAYDWANYRYAAGWINSSKQTLRSNEIVDHSPSSMAGSSCCFRRSSWSSPTGYPPRRVNERRAC